MTAHLEIVALAHLVVAQSMTFKINNDDIFTSQQLLIRNLAQTLDISEHSKSRLGYDWCYRLK
jgi:hypothetical protein